MKVFLVFAFFLCSVQASAFSKVACSSAEPNMTYIIGWDPNGNIFPTIDRLDSNGTKTDILNDHTVLNSTVDFISQCYSEYYSSSSYFRFLFNCQSTGGDELDGGVEIDMNTRRGTFAVSELSEINFTSCKTLK